MFTITTITITMGVTITRASSINNTIVSSGTISVTSRPGPQEPWEKRVIKPKPSKGGVYIYIYI